MARVVAARSGGMRRRVSRGFASAPKEWWWVKWKGNLVSGPPLADDAPLPPWGFVPHEVREEEFAKKEGKLRLTSGVDGFPTDAVREHFDRLAVDHEEFIEGSIYAYRALAEAFASADAGGGAHDFAAMDMTAPRLSLFLEDVRAAYAARGLVPRLAVDDGPYAVKAVAQYIGEEFGSVCKPGKFLGMWDGREVQHHVLAGFSPEITTSNEIRGGGPRRIVVHILFTVTEAFDAVPRDDCDEGTLVRAAESEHLGASSSSSPLHFVRILLTIDSLPLAYFLRPRRRRRDARAAPPLGVRGRQWRRA